MNGYKLAALKTHLECLQDAETNYFLCIALRDMLDACVSEEAQGAIQALRLEIQSVIGEHFTAETYLMHEVFVDEVEPRGVVGNAFRIGMVLALIEKYSKEEA
ncbi:hypothetical protein [Ferribacterium limneticum]|uniref:hypothetical protein n=1 Tax=Ferribacterium limneticum TaxID=76259 RepID=UPI001CF89535|nr:hypothetical protein [Ferribacterium limneticum]UCV26764.1 hypothetical protein KI617_10625 [Ferribacterium limneticum]UCV30681.1 hypothetical protein KI608_10625 [Ferribacterium limneticum]